MPHTPPPVPPEQQNPKARDFHSPKQDKGKASSSLENLKEQDRQGNIYQNTHNQGYQQDR